MVPCGQAQVVFCLVIISLVLTGSQGSQVDGDGSLANQKQALPLKYDGLVQVERNRKIVRVRRQAPGRDDYDIHFACHNRTETIIRCHKILSRNTGLPVITPGHTIPPAQSNKTAKAGKQTAAQTIFHVTGPRSTPVTGLRPRPTTPTHVPPFIATQPSTPSTVSHPSTPSPGPRVTPSRVVTPSTVSVPRLVSGHRTPITLLVTPSTRSSRGSPDQLTSRPSIIRPSTRPTIRRPATRWPKTTRPTRPTARSTTIPWWWPGQSTTPPASKKDEALVYIIPTAFGLFFVGLLVGICCCIYCKRRKKGKKPHDESIMLEVIEKPAITANGLSAPDGDTVKSTRAGSTKKFPLEDDIVIVPVLCIVKNPEGLAEEENEKNEQKASVYKDDYGVATSYEESMRALPVVTSLTFENELDHDEGGPPAYRSVSSAKKSGTGKQASKKQKAKSLSSSNDERGRAIGDNTKEDKEKSSKPSSSGSKRGDD